MAGPIIFGPDGKPQALPSKQLAWPISPFNVGTNYDQARGLGSVIITTKDSDQDLRFVLTPTEATTFGLTLLTEAVKAVDTAVMMRMLTEFGGIPSADALQVVKKLGKIVTQAHQDAEMERQQLELGKLAERPDAPPT